MVSDLLRAEQYAHHIVVGANEHGLAVQPPRDGVVVTVEMDAMRAPHAGRLEIIGIHPHVSQRGERGPLFMLEDERGDFAGLLVLAPVGECVAPYRALQAKIVEASEAATWEEA